jgi:hypothetical protein
MNISDESIAHTILRGLPRIADEISYRDAMVVVWCVRRKTPVHLPHVRPYVVGQMLALCMYNMGKGPSRLPPVCKNFRNGLCRAGRRCQFDHCGLPDDYELLRAMTR